MLAYVNGLFVPEDRPALTVRDRSFLYGDGLFETVRITNGQPFLWREHLERLRRGAEFLKIELRCPDAEIEEATRHLLAENDVPEGMVRIHLSRGVSERGYSTAGVNNPALVITTQKRLHAAPAGVRVITSSVRVFAGDPLTQLKTANRLLNILARQEADASGADEALILNDRGEVAEASAANLFVVRGEQVVTPPLDAGVLAGTTRGFVFAAAGRNGVEAALMPEDLKKADAVFVTSAHWLVTPVVALDGVELNTRGGEVVAGLRRACERAALGQ